MGECHAIYDEARGRFVAVAGRQTLEWDGQRWQTRKTAHELPLRVDYRIAYDPVRGRTVFFGGHPRFYQFSSGQPLDRAIWEYDGIDWYERSPGSGPVGRHGHAMAFDANRGRVTVIGGSDGQNALGDTWQWDGARWHSLSGGPPAPLLTPSMAWHAGSGHVVILGRRAGVSATETWTLDASGWVRATTSIQPVAGPMSADLASQRVLLRSVTPRLYAWDGTDWTVLTETGAVPDVTSGAGLATDDAGQTLLVGGFRPQPASGVPFTPIVPSGDTWSMRAGQWTRRVGYGPPTLGLSDVDRAGGVLMALDDRSLDRMRLWEWDGANWAARVGRSTEPPQTLQGAFRFDAHRRIGVLFGGSVRGPLVPLPVADVWEWDGLDWSLRQPASGPGPRTQHAMVFDGGRREILVFGGSTLAGRLDETWAWDGGTWRQAANGPAPPPRRFAAMAYDPIRDRIVLFGGDGGGSQPLNPLGDTWEWDGSRWTGRSPPGAPTPRYGHSMAFDPDLGRVVLAGGFVRQRGGTVVGDDEVWSWDGSAWRMEARRLTASGDVRERLLQHPTRRGLLAVRFVQDNSAEAVSLWIGDPDVAEAVAFGTGCGSPAPHLVAFGSPQLGAARFALDLEGAAAQSMAILGLEPNRGSISLVHGCSIFVQPPMHSTAGATTAAGRTSFALPVPAVAALLGATLHAQAGVLDASTAAGFALSRGVTVRVGW